MGIILAPIFLLTVVLWMILVGKFVKKCLQSTDRVRFFQIGIASALVTTALALLGTAISYVGQEVSYTPAMYLYVSVGPPTWALLFAYFIANRIANKREENRELEAPAASETFRAHAYGILLAIPIFVITFLFNVESLMKLLGVQLLTH